MLAGDLYIADDPELARDSLRAMCLMAKFNQGAAYSPGERRRILKKLLGAIGEGTEIRPSFTAITATKSRSALGRRVSATHSGTTRQRRKRAAAASAPRAMLGSSHPGCRRPLGTFSSSTMWWEAAGVSSVTPRSDEYGHGHYRQLSK